MFLDPDPRRAKQGNSRGSGFFSSQTPIESPRDRRTTPKRRLQPLAERTKSQINEQRWNDPAISTVRLVKPSPPRSGGKDNDSEDDQKPVQSVAKENLPGRDISLVKPASASDAGLPGFLASDLAKSVSGTNASANETQQLEQPDTTSLLYTTPAINAQTDIHAVPETEWHRRNHSNTSTLKGGEDSLLSHRSERSDLRLSQGTTLRGTPTPTEQELRQRIEADDSVGQTSLHSLQTLHEASPERSTLRVVAASEDGGSTDDPSSSEASASPIVQVFQSPTPSPERRPAEPYRQSSWQTLTSGSPQTVYITRRSSNTQTPREQRSQESIAQSESTYPALSSPNYVAYSSPTQSRPRSGTYPLYRTHSFESIESRLHNPTQARPQTGRSIATSSSWASLRRSSSHDTLPPLNIPKKRLRHKAGSQSLNAAANARVTSGYSMADEDIDYLPYPREQFASHLSTIASVSDRTNSQQLSHFSLGSGVLTGDDSSSIPLSGTWPRRRRESAPISSIISDGPISSSEEEAGDMTLGIFREGSAKPQPLQPRAGAVPGERKYEGPLPPLPPIPRDRRDSGEHADRLSELQPRSLREKRSGYSLRQRSNSTPSRSHSRHLSQMSRSDVDRSSQASSLFPTWAKNFYGHGAALMSPSKVSLAPPGTPRRDNGHANGHGRNDSQWTERSITSRLGTGYTEIDSLSPTSSHFLPSIFRPRTRAREKSDSKKRKSKRGRPSREDSRPDSLQIFSDPLPESRSGDPPAGDTLPSGHPKYGSLKDDPSQHRPLPRKYSKQKQWNDMQFPRPMTKDRLSDFNHNLGTPPHLEQNKRHSYRLSAWRPPSFVESLDTLVRARGNRQILLFALGFVCPLLWMLGAILPVPPKPASSAEQVTDISLGGSEDDIQTAMMKHEAGDAERRWREERIWRKAKWWRALNRVMSVVGILVIGAVIALAVIATR